MSYLDKWKEAISKTTSKIEIPDVEVPEMRVPELPVPDIPVAEITIPKIQVPDISTPRVSQGGIEMIEPISTDIVIPKPAIPDIKIPETITPRDIIPDIPTPEFPEQLEREIPIPEIAIPDILVQETPFPMVHIPEIIAISKPSIPAITFPEITEYNIFQQVKELKKWKETFADPNIIINIDNIESIYSDIKNNIIPNIEANIMNITSIYDDLKNNIAPSVNRAKDLAVAAMESSKINMDNISSIFIELKDNIVPIVNKAKDIALLAAENASKAEEFARAFILKLQLAGEVIAYGIEDLTINAAELYRTITMEVGELADGYIDFGTAIQTGAGKIVTELKELGAEMAEFIYEVRPSLNASARNARSAADAGGKLRDDISSTLHDIEDLKFDKAADHLRDFRRHIDTFADDGMDAIAYLLYRGADGQGAVIPELLEGLEEIGREAAQLSSAVFDLGLNLYNSSNEIARQNRYSFNAIRRQVNVFTNSFLRIFIDLNRVFTTEYTSQEIAKEQAKRRVEREIYISFKDDIYAYEVAASKCENSTRDLPIIQNIYNEALNDYKNAEANINTILLNIKNLINKYYPIEKVGGLTPATCNTQGMRIWGWAQSSCRYNSPSDVYGSGGTVSSPTSGFQVYITDPAKFRLYQFISCQRKKYRYFMCNKNKLLLPYVTKLNEAEVNLNNTITTKEESCGVIESLYNAFVSKWGTTPEEADLLSYEEIIQKT